MRKTRKCLAVRKISCNFATLLGAIRLYVIINSLWVNGISIGGYMNQKRKHF